MLLTTKLLVSACGHAIVHVGSIIRIMPTSYHKFFSLQFVFGQEQNISHLKIFGCAVFFTYFSITKNKNETSKKDENICWI